MKEEEFYKLLDEIMELPAGTITGKEKLSDIQKWDSLAVMGFISSVDRCFSMIIPGEKIFHCKTVQELRALLGEKIV